VARKNKKGTFVNWNADEHVTKKKKGGGKFWPRDAGNLKIGMNASRGKLENEGGWGCTKIVKVL